MKPCGSSNGVTWNWVARYFRCRVVPGGSIFSSESPTIRPSIDWLSTYALLALLNSDTVDFLLRTLLSSLMHIELGDVRRIVVPVLDPSSSEALDRLGREVRGLQADGGLGRRPERGARDRLVRSGAVWASSQGRPLGRAMSAPWVKGYSDNQEVTVADSIRAEIEQRNADRLWVASGYFAASVWDSIGSALASLSVEFRLLLERTGRRSHNPPRQSPRTLQTS